MSSICNDLRAAILQAAMQGKLTERFPDEKLDQKTQDALCSNIKNAPFEIPESWGYVNMGNVATHQNGYAFKPTDWKKEGLPIIRIQNLTDKKNTPHYADGHCIDDKFHITKGDVLVSWSCTIDAFLYDGPDAVLNQHIFKVIFNKIPIDKEYYILSVKALLKTIDSKRHGSTMTHITKKDYDSLLFPIPPLAEQKRIVEKVDELMARVADLEQSADALVSLEKAFPDDIEASLLQTAMQGKLTKQLPEDGSAEDLLEEIKAVKEKLIAEGKIKKQKTLAPIIDDEAPFSIPDNWKWVRLRDICTKIADGDHNPPKGLTHESEYLMLSSQNINNDTLVNMSKVRYLDKNTFEKVNERTNLQKEDILFTSVGSLGRSCIFREDINACFQRSVSVLTTLVYNEYLKLFLDSPFIQNKVYKEATGTAQKGFYLNQLEKCPIAIPPLAEQRRIVERLNTLMRNISVVEDFIASE